MGYYKTLTAILVVFLTSVVVQDGYLFQDEFFLVAYLIMAFVLVAGTKYEENYDVDFILGMFLIFSVGFLSTDLLLKFFTGQTNDFVFFKFAVVLCLDVCALNFLHLARERKKEYIELEKRKGSMFRKVVE